MMVHVQDCGPNGKWRARCAADMEPWPCAAVVGGENIRTEAGRALLRDWMNDDVANRPPPRGLVSEQIAAIERQARNDR